MPLGYCMHCERLKPIVKVGLRLGSRECEWAPVPHDLPEPEPDSIERIARDEHGFPVGPCPGSGRPIR